MTGDRCGRDPATPVMGIASWHRPLICLAAIMAVWAIVSVVGLAADTRTLGGDPLWAKPLKFAISFGVYALTLAWMLSLLRRPRLRRFAWWAGTVASAATLLEAAAISVQVVRGTGSHFNVATPLDSSLYALMRGGVVLMYAATVVIGSGLAFFSTFRDRALSWGLRLGLLIGLAGLSVGFLMVSPRAAARRVRAASPRVTLRWWGGPRRATPRWVEHRAGRPPDIALHWYARPSSFASVGNPAGITRPRKTD